MIMEKARTCVDLELLLIDTALRWRSLHDTGWTRRVLAGVPQLLSSVWKLLRIAITAKPDVVHVNTSGQLGVIRDVLLLTVSIAFRIPFIYHIRFGRVPSIATWNTLEWKVMTLVMRRSSAVIVLDELTATAVAEHLSEVPLSRVPNCVDVLGLPDIVPADGLTKTLLFVGWVLPSKGIEDLVEAWCKIDRTGWRLRIVGPCDDSFRMTILGRLSRGTSIEFLGEVSHSAGLELIGTCDLFVLPSHTEGFPNVVLEAMALGVAVVATDVGAIGEMLANGCGLVVPPANSAELSVALEKLMRDERRRNELGERAKAKARLHYSLESVFEDYINFWGQVVENGKVRKCAIFL